MANLEGGRNLCESVLMDIDDLLYVVEKHDYSGRLPNKGNKPRASKLTDEETERQQPKRLIHRTNVLTESLKKLHDNRGAFEGYSVPDDLLRALSGEELSEDVKDSHPHLYAMGELLRAEQASTSVAKHTANLDTLQARLLREVGEHMPALVADMEGELSTGSRERAGKRPRQP